MVHFILETNENVYSKKKTSKARSVYSWRRNQLASVAMFVKHIWKI